MRFFVGVLMFLAINSFSAAIKDVGSSAWQSVFNRWPGVYHIPMFNKSGYIKHMAEDASGNLLLCGDFHQAGNIQAENIAGYNKQTNTFFPLVPFRRLGNCTFISTNADGTISMYTKSSDNEVKSYLIMQDVVQYDEVSDYLEYTEDVYSKSMNDTVYYAGKWNENSKYTSLRMWDGDSSQLIVQADSARFLKFAECPDGSLLLAGTYFNQNTEKAAIYSITENKMSLLLSDTNAVAFENLACGSENRISAYGDDKVFVYDKLELSEVHSLENAYVKVMKYDNNNRLWFGGRFGEDNYHGVIYLDGSSLVYPQVFPGSFVLDLYMENGNLSMVAGGFQESMGFKSFGIANYDGETLTPLYKEFSGDCSERIWDRYENQLYCIVNENDYPDSNRVYVYSNGSWEAVPSNSSGTVAHGTIGKNGDLYLAGSFSEIAGVPLQNIGYWDGTSWNDMNGGVSGYIKNILYYPKDSAVIVTGSSLFGGTDSVNGDNALVWKNSQWHSIEGPYGDTLRLVNDSLVLFSEQQIWDGVTVRNFEEFFTTPYCKMYDTFDPAGYEYAYCRTGSSSYSDEYIGRWNGVEWEVLITDSTSGFDFSFLEYAKFTVDKYSRLFFWSWARSEVDSDGFGGIFMYNDGKIEQVSQDTRGEVEEVVAHSDGYLYAYSESFFPAEEDSVFLFGRKQIIDSTIASNFSAVDLLPLYPCEYDLTVDGTIPGGHSGYFTTSDSSVFFPEDGKLIMRGTGTAVLSLFDTLGGSLLSSDEIEVIPSPVYMKDIEYVVDYPDGTKNVESDSNLTLSNVCPHHEGMVAVAEPLDAQKFSYAAGLMPTFYTNDSLTGSAAYHYYLARDTVKVQVLTPILTVRLDADTIYMDAGRTIPNGIFYFDIVGYVPEHTQESIGNRIYYLADGSTADPGPGVYALEVAGSSIGFALGLPGISVRFQEGTLVVLDNTAILPDLNDPSVLQSGVFQQSGVLQVYSVDGKLLIEKEVSQGDSFDDSILSDQVYYFLFIKDAMKLRVH